MALFKNRVGHDDDPPTCSADFFDGMIPAGTEVVCIFFGPTTRRLITKKKYTAKTLCDFIDREYGEYITQDCGLYAITVDGNGIHYVITELVFAR